MCHPFLRNLCFALLSACVLGVPLAAGAQDANADLPHKALDKGEAWALLIGVEKYTKASPLRYTVNDVEQLTQTLIERGGYSANRVMTITDAQSDPDRRPLKSTLMEQLPEWLAKPGPEDQIVVYFTGHGFRDDEGHMYLAPLDCDPANPAATGIPIEWMRDQIAGCRARVKLLVLDACHAGSEKSIEEENEGVVAKDLAAPFRDLADVVTLASSTGEEKSQLWEEKRQSLFSYWLNQGLKGHADENGDGDVDIDELNKYVYRNVTHIAKDRFSREQTPVRIVRPGAPGVPTVLRLQPQSLRQVISDMANELAWAMQDRGYKKVGVLEFTNDTKLGELLGSDFGLLGRYCAAELQERLMKQGGGHFSVVDRRRLQAALTEQQMTVSKLGSSQALAQLSANTGGMPVIALGTLRNRLGRVVNLQCQLLETEGDALAGTAGGVAWLSESEWAMLGHSVKVSPDDRRPPLPGTEKPEETQTDRVVAKLDEHADAPHPMSDPNFAYPIRIRVGKEIRKPVFRGNEMFVPVREGETFSIEVENRSNQLVIMRLLVDGLNTLPQRADTKGILTYEVAKRVNLDEARPWILDPAKSKRFGIRGFVTETGAAGKLREFLVVDAEKSLAARKQFTDQIGLITAAFYAPSSSRGLGVDLGEERSEDLTERTGQNVGNLLAVVHIRYVDADTLAGME